MVNEDKIGTHSTHVEDLKNPIQLQPPARDLSLPIARSKVFDQFILPGQFVDLPLYFLNTSVIKSTAVGRSRTIHHRIDSHLQPIYGVAHRLAELLCLLSVGSPPKRVTDVGAEYP